MDIHFIHSNYNPENDRLLERLAVEIGVGDSHDWESGYWDMAEAVAKQAIGGNLYLHRDYGQPSCWGGVIAGYRVVATRESARHQGKIIFRFRPSRNHKGIPAGGGPCGSPQSIWGNGEMICRESPGRHKINQ